MMTLLEELETRAASLSDAQRAAFAARLIATLPPVLVEPDEGSAEALRRDAELDSNPAAGVSEAAFRASLAALRKR